MMQVQLNRYSITFANDAPFALTGYVNYMQDTCPHGILK